MSSKVCPEGKILNPKTGRCVNIDGKIGKQVLAELLSKITLNESSSSSKSKTPPLQKLEVLHKKQMDAMRNRNIPLIKELAAQMDEIRKQLPKSPKTESIPEYLKSCIDPTTGELPKIPTMNGDEDMMELIKDPKQIITIDQLCYDIKSLYDLIQVDISQGNVWGVNPYVKREGLVLPFEKTVKDLVLSEGIKRKFLSKNTKWVDHTPEKADDKEMRGYYILEEKMTPTSWLKHGWASDNTAFPTKKYYAITFEFPNRRLKQNPGRTVIFPHSKEAKKFIDEKLIPVYTAGALWSKKVSITDGIEVLNQNVHMVFEDNQPNRWYANKIKNLEEEILKYAPAFV